ncbi:hypothetical protein DPMN_154969 [Dreissena polymorpha]|uniref:Uncharacterized protein n=1 Tax=Dreissena polymorpha TaxID=45954 RepID=A0A9D4J687_DREPO|nr:hypothetical protein DPMN_154969 [Dreissena polymorpha]
MQHPMFQTVVTRWKGVNRPPPPPPRRGMRPLMSQTVVTRRKGVNRPPTPRRGMRPPTSQTGVTRTLSNPASTPRAPETRAQRP